MKKHFLKLQHTLCILMLGLAALIACNKNEAEGEENANILVENVELPTQKEFALGDTLTIQGKGFTVDDQIICRNLEQDLTVEIRAITSNSITIRIPTKASASASVGTNILVLQRGDKVQILGSIQITSGIIVTVSLSIPDSAFRNYLLSEGYVESDGVLNGDTLYKLTAEGNVTRLSLSNKGIANLKGIALFSKLTTLFCDRNQLTSLDVSNNNALTTLSCENNQLDSLDVSNNNALTTLYCYSNKLTRLDASKMVDPTSYALYCGNQKNNTSLTLTLREEQKTRWETLKVEPNNTNVVLQ